MSNVCNATSTPHLAPARPLQELHEIYRNYRRRGFEEPITVGGRGSGKTVANQFMNHALDALSYRYQWAIVDEVDP